MGLIMVCICCIDSNRGLVIAVVVAVSVIFIITTIIIIVVLKVVRHQSVSLFVFFSCFKQVQTK